MGTFYPTFLCKREIAHQFQETCFCVIQHNHMYIHTDSGIVLVMYNRASLLNLNDICVLFVSNVLFFFDETRLGVKHHFLVASLIEKSTVCSHVRSPQRSGNKMVRIFFNVDRPGMGWDRIIFSSMKQLPQRVLFCGVFFWSQMMR